MVSPSFAMNRFRHVVSVRHARISDGKTNVDERTARVIGRKWVMYVAMLRVVLAR